MDGKKKQKLISNDPPLSFDDVEKFLDEHVRLRKEAMKWLESLQPRLAAAMNTNDVDEILAISYEIDEAQEQPEGSFIMRVLANRLSKEE